MRKYTIKGRQNNLITSSLSIDQAPLPKNGMKKKMHKSNNVSYIPSFLSYVKGFIDQVNKRTKKEKEEKGE
jgi:hypothetical protein